MYEIYIFASLCFIPEAWTLFKAARSLLLTDCFPHIKTSSTCDLTTSRLSESCIFRLNSCWEQLRRWCSKTIFPTREGNGQKATLFSFCIKCRKMFPTLLYRNVMGNILTLKVNYTKVKCSTFCSAVLRALARKLHPCYLLFHLLSSCGAVTLSCSKAVSILGWRVSS